jgi:hypothetical protein
VRGMGKVFKEGFGSWVPILFNGCWRDIRFFFLRY